LNVRHERTQQNLSNLCHDLLFAQLEIDSRLDEDVAALNVDDATNIHVLELFTVLLVHDVQVVTGDLLSKTVSDWR
jgi:hypothetical protein